MCQITVYYKFERLSGLKAGIAACHALGALHRQGFSVQAEDLSIAERIEAIVCLFFVCLGSVCSQLQAQFRRIRE